MLKTRIGISLLPVPMSLSLQRGMAFLSFGNIHTVPIDYFRILPSLVPRKHVPKVWFSVLGIPGGLSAPRGQAKTMEKLALGHREGTGEQICWGLPFRGECPVQFGGTMGRTSCFEGQVST